MSLSNSKASFILANGDPITIIRQSGNIATTGRIMAMKRRTGFFSINYLREALFVPTSGLQRGDLIQDQTTGEQFFIEGYQTKTRSGVVSSINAELYAVNYPSVQIQRLQKNYDSNLNSTGQTWVAVATVPANVEHVRGIVAEKDGLLLPETEFLVTMQTSTSVQLFDRFLIDSHPYKADDINLSIIPGLQIIQLSQDTR